MARRVDVKKVQAIGAADYHAGLSASALLVVYLHLSVSPTYKKTKWAINWIKGWSQARDDSAHYWTGRRAEMRCILQRRRDALDALRYRTA